MHKKDIYIEDTVYLLLRHIYMSIILFIDETNISNFNSVYTLLDPTPAALCTCLGKPISTPSMALLRIKLSPKIMLHKPKSLKIVVAL